MFRSRRPDEVKIITGMDSSVPNQVEYSKNQNRLMSIAALLGSWRNRGSGRLLLRWSIASVLSDASRNGDGRSEDGPEKYMRNRCVLDEKTRKAQNLSKLKDVNIRESVRVSHILSRQTVEELEESFEYDWIEEHQKLGINPRICILDGGHCIHQRKR